MGHHVIMGRKTFESIKKPLPGRTNLIISSTMASQEGVLVFSHLEQAVDYARGQGETELFICGGARVYEEALSFAQYMYLTKVDYSDKGDVFFPQFDSSNWEVLVHSKRAKKEEAPAWELFGMRRK